MHTCDLGFYVWLNCLVKRVQFKNIICPHTPIPEVLQKTDFQLSTLGAIYPFNVDDFRWKRNMC